MRYGLHSFFRSYDNLSHEIDTKWTSARKVNVKNNNSEC